MKARAVVILTFHLVALLALAGCKTKPIQNERLNAYAPTQGYRYANIAPGPDNSDSLFVVLTFSGGGTRAAALAYGVLEKLRDTRITWEGRDRRLLDEVDIISSVSGGSLPAAYYGLFGDRIFEDFSDKVLYTNIQKQLLHQFLSLKNYARLASPFYGRSDLVGDQFSRDIFENKTFNDLIDRNRRPFISLNATDLSLGAQFRFIQRQFDLLYSDLGPYPVGHAVAASAAFPGLLTAKTLRNYDKGDDYRPPTWVTQELNADKPNRARHARAMEAYSYIAPGRPYIHLTDGGVSDNLGILPIINLFSGVVPNESILNSLQSGIIKKVVIITVDAKKTEKSPWDSKANLLGIFKLLTIATSAPLTNYSEGEITYLTSYLDNLRARQEIRDELAKKLGGEDAVHQQFPKLYVPKTDFTFVEVAFDQLRDPKECEFLNEVPTSFSLTRDQVDHLRAAAGAILDKDSDFQTLLNGLK